jgi:amino-acid N-acetyltransferase
MRDTERPNFRDIPDLARLNNLFSAEGLTLPRDERWVEDHLQDYRIVRSADGRIAGCVCVDEYSPSLAEIVSLAVEPALHGQGIGSRLIQAGVALARTRGYDEIFAVSFADHLFEKNGFAKAVLADYPEKKLRYELVRRDEIEVGEKHCFARALS